MKNVSRILSLALIIAMCASLFTACLGTQNKTDSLKVTSLLNEYSIELKLQTPVKGVNVGEQSVGRIVFTSKMPLAEFHEELSAQNEGLSIGTAPSGLLIFIKGDDTFQYPSMLTCFSGGTENRFVFMDMRMEVIYGHSGDEYESFHLYMPYHLFSDARLQSGGDRIIYSEVEYETSATMNEFSDFFKQIGWYHIEIKDNSLIINSYAEGVDGEELPEIQSIIISFREHLGKQYCTVYLSGDES